MDPFLVKKWDHVFNVFFDVNKSETLEWDDFEMIVNKIKESRGNNSKEHAAAKFAMKHIWESLSKYDIDKDKKVSKKEWRQMWEAIAEGKDQNARWQSVYLEYMFMLFDKSGDNLLDKGEYATVMGYYGIKAVDAQVSFDKFSKHPIDFKKFCSLWDEYFKSKDPKAPGNHLFGPLN